MKTDTTTTAHTTAVWTAVGVAVCCGAASWLAAAGLIAAGAGLLGSPELTVGAVVLAGVGVGRAGMVLRRRRHADRQRQAGT